MTAAEAIVGLTHFILLDFVLIGIAIPVFFFWKISEVLKKDEAIDAATFLALRELRERFERTK